MVTSVERGGAVDVSSDERRLLFPHSVVPHPAYTALYTREKKREKRKKEKEVEVVWAKTQRTRNNKGTGTGQGRGEMKKRERNVAGM